MQRIKYQERKYIEANQANNTYKETIQIWSGQ